MCAECHSTGVRKNYDPKTRRFATSYAEVNVACEACHGPGSDHVAWARKEGDRTARGRSGQGARGHAGRSPGRHVDDQRGDRQCPAAPPRAGRPARSRCADTATRAGASSPRTTLPAAPSAIRHRVALLEDRLYYPDGQIRDEVYEYGSFLQSEMFHRGVTCSDCHDPHRAQAPRAREPGVPRLPLHAEVHGGDASLPPGGVARGRLPRLPHADHHLHGGGPTPRP